MQVQVIAKIEMPVFVATDEHGECVVFSLEDSHPVELGDVLRGDFEGTGGLDLTVEDLTQHRSVRIRLEDWGCTRPQALHRLHHLGAASAVWTLDPARPGRHRRSG